MSQKRIFNNIFIKGNGKVGTALKNFFTKNNITFFDYDKSLIQNKDVVFLAIKDESINIFIQDAIFCVNPKISSISSGLKIPLIPSG